MVLVNKPIKGMDLQRYTTFDNSVVILSNIPDYMADEYTNTIHRLVVEESSKYGFTLVKHQESQAGIACVLAPFRTEEKMAFELIVIVFEREKGRTIMKESPNIRGLPLVLKSAIWYTVARFYPEGGLVLERGPTDKVISMTMQKLFDGTFRSFKMKMEGQ